MSPSKKDNLIQILVSGDDSETTIPIKEEVVEEIENIQSEPEEESFYQNLVAWPTENATEEPPIKRAKIVQKNLVSKCPICLDLFESDRIRYSIALNLSAAHGS